MKILMTGGAGFIASNIADAYINKGYEVAIIDNLSSGKMDFVNKRAKFYEADIRDGEKITEIFKKEKPEILNHHAAQMSVRHSVEDPAFDAGSNIIGLLNLLEAGRKNGLKKVIFASSGGAIYGDAGTIPTSEDYNPKLPLSPYGVSKLASEQYLYVYLKTYNLPYIALRYSNVYGPRQNPHGEAGVVAIFCQKLLSGKKPTINGDGKQTRDYVFVKDLVRANINAIDSGFIGGINIATGKETDVNKVFSKIEEIIKKGLPPVYGPAKKGEQKRSCLDIHLAKASLNWEPDYSLEQGLSETVAYFRK